MPTAVVPQGGTGLQGEPSPLVLRGLIYWSAVGGFLLIAASLMAPIILLGSVIAPLLVCDRKALMAELQKINPLTVVLAIAAVYLTINATWSLDKKSATVSVATLYAIVVVTRVCASAVAVTDERYLRAMRMGAVIGVALGAAFLCFEYATNLSIQRSLQRIQDIAGLRLVRINVSDAKQGVFTFVLNRNLVALVILVWIVGLIQLRLDTSTTGRRLAAALFAIVALSAALSPSASAKLGFLAGGAVLAVHFFALRFARVLLTSAWCALCLFALPIADRLYAWKLYDASWLPNSARHRIVIWGATSDWYWKTPWFGSGVGSARGLPALDPQHRVGDHNLQNSALNWHAHNAYLQAWFEAGLMGALLLLVLGLLVLREIYRAPGEDQKFLAAAFASAMAAASTAFSLWAAWFLAVFGVAVVFSAMTGPSRKEYAQSGRG